MPKNKLPDEQEFTIKLQAASKVTIERALAAIQAQLGDLQPIDGFQAQLKIKGGQQLADRMEQVEQALRSRLGCKIELTSKRTKQVEPSPSASSFWDPEVDAKMAEFREEEARRRASSTHNALKKSMQDRGSDAFEADFRAAAQELAGDDAGMRRLIDDLEFDDDGQEEE